MKEIKAARLLSTWKSSKRTTVSVSKQDYDELLFKVPRISAAVIKDDGAVVFVILDKEVATNFLKSEYNLYETTQCPTSKS